MGHNGVLVIDKSPDWTSMDVCAKVRGIFHEKRVGHGGTLDPMATGVLPVFLGRATRAVEYVTDGEKEYLAQLRLGVVTTTQDVTGEVTATDPVPADAEARLREILPQFTGKIQQIPPMYSAIKKEGKKLYELARKGIEVERQPRPVTIHTLEVSGGGKTWDYGGQEPEAPNTFFLRVRCSKGTYIRTLCHDLGQALGCGGCMAGLRRTRVGQFTLDHAITIAELEKTEDLAGLLRPVADCFPGPEVAIDGLALKRALCGNPFPLSERPGTYKVFDREGRFLLLGRCDGRECRILKSFYEVAEG